MPAEPRTKQQQVAWELSRRSRVAMLAVAGGVLYELSQITLSAVLRNVPTVGALQGIGPALHGVATPAVSPRTAEVRYVSHHAFGAIAGSVLAAIAVACAAIALSFVYDATRFRRPASWPPAGRLVLFGGIGVALLSVVYRVIQAITTHSFATGHDFSNQAADRALTTNAPQQAVTYVNFVVGLCFAVGVVTVALNAMRAGLFPRPLGYVGVLVGLLFALPLPLQIIIALWLLAVGILLLGRWPSGDPPAWEAAEARPWPTAAEARAARDAGGAGSRPDRGGGRRGARAAAEVIDPVPEPARPATASRRRKRKRGTRR